MSWIRFYLSFVSPLLKFFVVCRWNILCCAHGDIPVVFVVNVLKGGRQGRLECCVLLCCAVMLSTSVGRVKIF